VQPLRLGLEIGNIFDSGIRAVLVPGVSFRRPSIAVVSMQLA